MSRRAGILLADNDGADGVANELFECAFHQFTSPWLGVTTIPSEELPPGFSDRMLHALGLRGSS